MTDALDLLQCPSCGAFYKPVLSVTGRYIPHCRLEAERRGISLGQVTEYEWLHGEVEIDWAAAEARTLAWLEERANMSRIMDHDGFRLTDVVDPPLTMFEKGRRMLGRWFWEIVMLIALALALVWFETTPAYGQCAMSYCKDKAPTRTYITNTHRQKVGDLYSVPGQRTQIRNKHRQIIGYIESDGAVTNTRRQKKGQLHE